MDRLFGYAGKLLRVDLTEGQTTDEKLDEKSARKYIGGTGIGAKYLYEEVHAGVEWDDEGNRMIMASGPLGGTRIGGSGTFSVVTKSPLTNGAVATQANGFFGAYLRFSGYDGIILQGKAKDWVYLYIHDGEAELRDASHLIGKDTWETAELIKEEFGKGERGVSVACIGPAGENLVKFSCVMVDKGHAASSGGAGAVMGAKKIKAVVVARSTSRPPLKDKEAVTAAAHQFFDNTVNHPILKEGSYKWGTLNGVINSTIAKNGMVPVKNYTTNIYDIEPEKLEKYSGPYIRGHFEPKREPCWACRFHHCHTLTITEGPFEGYVADEPEYECFAAFGPVIGVTDVTATIFLASQADRLGIGANESGWILGLVMECFEKGVLSPEDCDGLEMTWGNYEAANQMLHRIANRQGIGDVLAEGVMRAARKIGGEAPNFAIHTMKGNTIKGHDHRTRWPVMFDTCLAQIGTDEGFVMAKPEDLGLSIKPDRKLNNSPEDAVNWNTQVKGATLLEDSLGVCMITVRTDLKLLAEAVSAATGWDFPVEETMEVGKRIVNLLRVFNVRHGHTPEMDAPSPRYGSIPPDGPAKGMNIMPHWDKMRSKYYEQMGWDSKTGKPLPETLKRYDLEEAIPELWGE
ncbi:aldehyde ferredoxin oxidoreductase family protein [Thermodesulfobacteriota bacterium]